MPTSYPPSEKVWWLCYPYGGRVIHVAARLWIDAREEASRIVGCHPETILCVRDESDGEPEIHLKKTDTHEANKYRLVTWQSSLAAH